MEKRVILAIVISCIILFVYSALVQKFYGVNPPPSQERPQKEGSIEEAKGPFPSLPSSRRTLDLPKPRVSLTPNDLFMETDTFKISFDEEGCLEELRLKKYRRRGGEGCVDLVPNGLGRPCGIYLGATQPIMVDLSRRGMFQRRFEYEIPGEPGIKIMKEYLFSRSGYTFDVNLRVKNSTSSFWRTRRNGLLLMWSCMGFGENEEDAITQSYLRSDRVEKVKLKKGLFDGARDLFFGSRGEQDKVKAKVIDGDDLGLISMKSRYFLVALLPKERVSEGVFYKIGKGDEYGMGLGFKEIALPPNEEIVLSTQVYAGPKNYSLLKTLGAGLEKLTDLNLLSLLVLRILNSFYGLTKNYGIAIILLTLVVKLILFPLSHKSVMSMKKLQIVQPQINVLKERFKNDRERLNREIIDLYKRHKVNPLGGCLPLLLQLPVFFALFTALRSAIELRDAPFFGWIKDLSLKDPFFALPILTGITMYLQQKLTPQSTPGQHHAIFTYVMPVFLTIMFLNFPSGLVLYFLTQNVLSIAQQILTNKFWR